MAGESPSKSCLLCAWSVNCCSLAGGWVDEFSTPTARQHLRCEAARRQVSDLRMNWFVDASWKLADSMRRIADAGKRGTQIKTSGINFAAEKYESIEGVFV